MFSLSQPARLKIVFSPLRGRSARYLAALGAVALAVAVQAAFRPFFLTRPFLLLFLAVAFSGWYCGLGPGMVALAVSAISALLLFLPRVHLSLEPSQAFALLGYVAVSLASFVSVSLAILLMGSSARSALINAELGRRKLQVLSDELETSEKQFRHLADAIPQIVWTATADGVLDYANSRWIAYRGEGVGPAQAADRGVFPADRALVEERWREARRSRTTFEVEFRFQRASDGMYRWFLARGVPVEDESGTIVKWFGTSTDIHDQRLLRDRARFLAEATRLLSSSLDYGQTLQSVAASAVPDFADWAAVDLLSDGKLSRVAVAHQDPAKASLAREIFERAPEITGAPQVMRTGTLNFVPEISQESLQQIADLDLRAFIAGLGLRSAIVVPMVARGATVGVISLVLAESERRYTADDVAVAEDLGRRAGVAVDNARLYRDSQEASRLKDEFLSTLSHELRTPLTAVLGWARILGTGDAELSKLKRGLSTIERNAKAQARLIDDLLDLSRIVTGKLRLNVRSFDPQGAIEASLETVRPAADLKSVQLASVLDPGAGPVVGDPDRLQQIVWNLLSNAIKFTPRGGRVQIRLARLHSQIEIEVFDTGMGIDPAFLPFVFERFRQADASVSRAQGGLGLGLSIVRHLVELHGGTVEAESEGLGKGACFRVLLPLAAVREGRSHVGGAHPISSGAARALREAPMLAGVRVLVAEDAPDAREMLAEVLGDRGADVTLTAGGEEALALLRRERYEVLISDLGMPDLDGFSLIREVRKLADGNAQVRAVALTAYARSEDRTRALVEGFDVHMPKPVEPAELVAVVAALVRRRS
jgi:PAS domain S-box-containing protein